MEHVDVLIIGAGISGIGMGCRLKMKNPNSTFTILEGRAAIGGTWDLFRYPGIRSDSDMYTFGYDFKPWRDDRDIASGEAIREYLQETVDEYGLLDHIRFQHRVEKLSWCSKARQWVAQVRCGEARSTLSASFVVTCTGYYNYAAGHLPKFEDLENFQGRVVHPQHWPKDLDYKGKRVLVIGSGATAVTLVPAMASEAAHVTMLQRSPTYIFSRPAKDRIAAVLKRALPIRVAHPLIRAKNVMMQRFMFFQAKNHPERVKTLLRNMAAEQAGPKVDVDVHFKPRYEPWDQRVCLVPDGDLFEALRGGSASIVTDTIERFTENGVQLSSGQTLEADVVVTATGLSLQFLGGAQVEIDGEPIEGNSLISYRGMMFSGLPNWVSIFGYTSASWTLKSDLIADFVCRLRVFMKEKGHEVVMPKKLDSDFETETVMSSLSSAGYIRRAIDRMPRQGLESPWRNSDNYLKDFTSIKWGRIDDGVLRFSSGENVRPLTARFVAPKRGAA